jgi:hypothetical protein
VNWNALQPWLSPALIAVLGWFFKQALGRVTDRIDRLESRAAQAEREIQATRENAVSRESHIRESSRVRTTLETLLQGLARVEGKMDIGNRIATSMESIAQDKRDKAGTDGKDS